MPLVVVLAVEDEDLEFFLRGGEEGEEGEGGDEFGFHGCVWLNMEKMKPDGPPWLRA